MEIEEYQSPTPKHEKEEEFKMFIFLKIQLPSLDYC